MTGVSHLTVGPGEGDLRLDRWLRRQFPHLAQAHIEKMCRKGEIRVDSARVKPATRLAEGQHVRLPPIPAPLPQAAPAALRPAAVSAADAAMIRAAVLWQDADMIALDKPPGLAVQGGSGTERHVDALAAALVGDGEEKPRLVHRLDRDTSGVLLLARSARAAAALTRAFRDRETRKIYWAAVAGVPNPRMGTIRFGLVKSPGHGHSGENEKMRLVLPDKVDATEGAKRATTDYAVLSALGRRAAWVALVPVTGR
ncbi:MAG: RluA family pseudouridine synthase, partial [Alphaproteobacteria bacterium HGW-Alphaproteobacteria-2]